MARIRWHGAEYTCKPVRQVSDTVWRFKMRDHGPRWAAGSEIEVAQNDIVEMAAAELPIVRDASLAALDAAMAAERQTLPTVQELLADARAQGTLVNAKPEEGAPAAADAAEQPTP